MRESPNPYFNRRYLAGCFLIATFFPLSLAAFIYLYRWLRPTSMSSLLNWASFLNTAMTSPLILLPVIISLILFITAKAPASEKPSHRDAWARVFFILSAYSIIRLIFELLAPFTFSTFLGSHY